MPMENQHAVCEWRLWNLSLSQWRVAGDELVQCSTSPDRPWEIAISGRIRTGTEECRYDQPSLSGHSHQVHRWSPSTRSKEMSCDGWNRFRSDLMLIKEGFDSSRVKQSQVDFSKRRKRNTRTRTPTDRDRRAERFTQLWSKEKNVER